MGMGKNILKSLRDIFLRHTLNACNVTSQNDDFKKLCLRLSTHHRSHNLSSPS